MGDTQDDRSFDSMTRPGGLSEDNSHFSFYGCVQSVARVTPDGVQEITIALLGTNSVIRLRVPDVALTMPDGSSRYFPGRQVCFDMHLWPSDAGQVNSLSLPPTSAPERDPLNQ